MSVIHRICVEINPQRRKPVIRNEILVRNRRAQNDAINVYDREERGHNAVDGHSGLVALLLQLLDNRLNSADGTRKA